MTRKKNILLYPASLLYGLLTGFRNFLYDTGILCTTKFDFPVICVGNITVGGTGKTPHTEYLVDLLRKDYKMAILSRGYKRKSKGFQIATLSTTVNDIGDEPLQISRKFNDIVVAVDRKRVHGVQKILHDFSDTEVIILDDGFQHRSLTPGYSIVLSDYSRPIMGDHMLPYGDLRESRENIRRADVILITKCPENISPMERRLIVKEINKSAYQNLYFTSFKYYPPQPLCKENLRVVKQGPECGIVLVTGVANPQPLKEHLQKSCSEIIHLSFPDHHNFIEKDLADIAKAFNSLKSQTQYLFTTEKDAVRLREFINIAEPMKSAFYYIPIGIYFLNEDKEEFDNLIIDYVRKNHRNN